MTLSVSSMEEDRPVMLHSVSWETGLEERDPVGTKERRKAHVLPPPRGLFVASQFMKPLQLLTSSFCFRDKV